MPSTTAGAREPVASTDERTRLKQFSRQPGGFSQQLLTQSEVQNALRDSRILAAVSYVAVAFILPFFFLLVPYLAPALIYTFVKQDKFVRFNALQAFVLAFSYSIMFTLVSLTVVGLIISVPSVIIYWLFCAWAALESYNGRLVHIPGITDLAKSHI